MACNEYRSFLPTAQLRDEVGRGDLLQVDVQVLLDGREGPEQFISFRAEGEIDINGRFAPVE